MSTRRAADPNPTETLRPLVLYGTRPELIKLHPVLARLREDDRFEPRVVATNQHRELLDGLLGPLSVAPDFELDVLQPDQSLADITTRTLAGLTPILAEVRPDLVLVQGDTSSAFAGALAASYLRIPVGHVEAGLRSFDPEHPFPEELNRRLISVAAGLHFAPLESNRDNLVREGVDPARIFVTGNTVIDALREIQPLAADALGASLPPGALDGRRMILVSAHRRESFDVHLAELCHGLQALVSKHPDVVVVYPVHLNPNVRRAVMPLLGGHERIHLIEPLAYPGFVDAMSRAHLILTDSGGVQEEAPALGTPVLVFRRVTERVEGVAAAGARLVGLERDRLVAEVSHLLEDDEDRARMTCNRDLYGDGQAARRIVEAILHDFGRGERPVPFRSGGSGS